MTETGARHTNKHKHRAPHSYVLGLQRAGRALLISSVVAFTLVAFPSILPWTIAVWLAWHTAAVIRGQPGCVPLVACLALLLIKRVYWPVSLLMLVGMLVIVALLCARWRLKRTSRGRLAWIGTIALWVVWGCVWYEWQTIASCSHPVKLDAAQPIVCVGDSLTSGLLPDRGYPEPLSKLLCVPVVNLGQSGITTQDGLSLLPRITAENPQVVVIELGGHDFLKGKSRAETKENLEQLIAGCRKIGAEVVLVEIPRGFIYDSFSGLEREIAHDQDLELVADTAIRQLVLWSPIAPPGMWLPDSHLSDDGLHTNPRGSEYLARRVAHALERMYGKQILGIRHDG